jgi:hypothetical protein
MINSISKNAFCPFILRGPFVALLCCTFLIGQSQTIHQYEYFFDTDPGVGNGLSTTIDANNTFVADVSSLTNGLHNLYVRVKNNSSGWSLTSAKTFIKQSGGVGTNRDSITRYEYFIDTDPGFGNGKKAVIDSNKVFIADLSLITNGLHQFHMRVQDASGLWSLLHTKSFMTVTNANNKAYFEYFIDTDTGLGNGKTLMTDANGQSTILLDSVSAGVHQLIIRARDSLGNWSLTHQKTFFKFDGTGENTLARMEYFWDTDPGLGNATAITGFTSVVGQPVIHEFSPNTNNLPIGPHTLYVRVKDNSGSWSLLHSVVISTTIPVELLSFEVKQIEQSAQLNWQTASELNSNRFDIERSTDGQVFTKIGAVKAVGSTNQLQKYVYTDTLLPPQFDHFYYRLNQVHNDDKTTYSPVKALKINRQNKEKSIHIYPNPNSGTFMVTIAAIAFDTDLMIQNSHGQVIWKGAIAANKQSQIIQLQELTNGLYFMSARDNQGIMNTIKFVINR